MKNLLTNRSLETITTVVEALSELDARAISAMLTNPGSEFQAEVMNREGSRTPIAILRDGPWRVAAWAASRRIEEMQTLECFTHPEFRRRGYCRAAVSLLVAASLLDRGRPIAVTSPSLVGVACQVGFTAINILGESRQLAAVLELSPLRWSPSGGVGDEPASAGWSHSG